MRHLLSPLDFSVDELARLLDLARDISKNPSKYGHVCDGKKIATLFYEPSTRTRLSFEAAFFNSCATLFTEDFYKPMCKGKSEATYVLVGRIATVVVVILGMAWIPIMMSLGSLYDYLQGIQSLLAPAMVAVFALGIFSKRITPKAGEVGMIVGFIIGMVRLLTNIFTNTGKDVMNGWYWEYTSWFWQTNWLIFEIWLLVFLLVLMAVVSCFTPKPTAEQIEAITFTGSYKKLIRESWNKWDVIASLGVVILCALFYIYFW